MFSRALKYAYFRSKKGFALSKAHVARLLQESHFAHATSHMNPIAKAFLEFYLNIAKSVEIFSEYVETLVAASQSEHCTHISETSIAKLAVVADAISSFKRYIKLIRCNQQLLC